MDSPATPVGLSLPLHSLVLYSEPYYTESKAVAHAGLWLTENREPVLNCHEHDHQNHVLTTHHYHVLVGILINHAIMINRHELPLIHH